jgi:C-terminal processing protease CtpA/Prc
MRIIVYLPVILLALESCSVSKSSVAVTKKYSREQLLRDYDIYESALEESHPGLYWYTSKDSMHAYFNWGREQIRDSATEPEFRKILTYVTAQINCGHTTVRSSKAFARVNDTARIKLFPLSLKIWGNEDDQNNITAVITTNLFRRDSILKRGTIIRSIDGLSINYLFDTMSRYVSSDGYNRTHKFQSISNTGTFGRIYTTLFGLKEKYTIGYADSTGAVKQITIPVYDPVKDTALRRAVSQLRKLTKKEQKNRRLETTRILKIDTVSNTAYMELQSFGRDYKLRPFFRQSFRNLQKHHVDHLIIDVRSNGGGSVGNSTVLSKYLVQQPFKIGDSLYAIDKRSHYGKYIQNNFFNKLFITFLTRRNKRGEYHFGYFERHYFKPKKHNHFDGKTYILTGGNSFSATILFTSSIMHQDNVTVVGEETGGGAYGNTAWLIPDFTLPETGVRFRLPLFRLVIDKNIPKNGRGLIPEVASLPTQPAIAAGRDFKLDTALELIKKDKEQQSLKESKVSNH